MNNTGKKRGMFLTKKSWHEYTNIGLLDARSLRNMVISLRGIP
jgi:hypothetical protein